MKASFAAGLEFRFSHAVPVGLIFSAMDWMGKPVAFMRHYTDLYMALHDVRWHPEPWGCPTWDTSTECRCMTEDRP